jgi:ATP-dependent protease HslVU (ClpYQ) peptidase subunit
MSIVVGYVGRQGTYLAADYQVTSDDGHKDYEANKIFNGGEYLLGVAGDYKIVTLMEYFDFKLPAKKRDKFIITGLPLLVKEYLSPYAKENDKDGGDEYDIIIACKQGLFEINDNHEACPVPFFHAIGTGAPYAFGAYHALKYDDSLHDEEFLDVAVNAAIRYNAFCGGGVAIESLPD